MIRRIAHLCFTTDDLPRMVAFYTDKLGLPIKITFRTKDDEIFGHYVDCGGSSFIEIFDRDLKRKQWGGEDQPLTGGNQYNHFCLEVTGLADFKAALEAKGVKVGEIRSGMDGSLQAWTSDPDRNAIELMEYTTRSLQIQPEPGTAR